MTLGATTDQREVADRKRTVKARKAGATKGAYRTYSLLVPSWLSREIAGSDDPDVIEARMREYEYLPEKTVDGILYRPTKLIRRHGWDDS